MGLAEIIFSTIAFIVIWFIVFKVLLVYEKKKPLKNIGKKIEAQEGKVFNIQGKRAKLSGIEDEEEEPKPKPATPTPEPKKKVAKKKATKKVTKKKR